MSDRIQLFSGASGATAVALPFELAGAIRDWSALRVRMARAPADGFTRDEWAYLVSFLDGKSLERLVHDAIGGAPASERCDAPRVLLRPRGQVAVWLPGNVSLLGPLIVVLLSLTGCRMRLKAASGPDDLTARFLAFALARLPAGALRSHLEERVLLQRFGRDDPRNAEMASEAALRIVFGSDAAAEAIHALPHPVDSVGVSFSDRRSEAWLDAGAVTDDTLTTLAKVFAIYGRAGCTSPRRVVLLDAPATAASALRDRLLELWPRAIRDVPMHVASANVMAAQWSRAAGWDARLPARHGAVLATGPAALEAVDAPMFLPVHALPLEAAEQTLPANVQTLGCAFSGRAPEFPIELAARSRVKRVVPLAQMHHFSSVWDGHRFWRAAFEEVQLES